jgi:predicted metal-dependent phosphoesterase TrpH
MLIDLHCHTTRSMDSFLDPADAVRAARAAGLGAVCFTEHDKEWDREEIADFRRAHDFLVLRGVEVSTEIGHVLAFGLSRFDLEMRSFAILAEECSEAGGALVLAHPYRRFYGMTVPTVPSEDDVALALHRRGWDDLQAIEIWNAETRRIENLLAAAVAERLMLATTGGSDAHRPDEVSRCYTVVDGDVASERDLVAAIREHRVRGVSQAELQAVGSPAPSPEPGPRTG